MFIIRDNFHLKLGMYKDAKLLMDEEYERKMLPESQGIRVLSDFTGDFYRLMLEDSYKSLSKYETSLTSEFTQAEWQAW